MTEAEELVALHIRVPREQRELLHQARLRVRQGKKHLTIQQIVLNAINNELRRVNL